MSDIEVTIIVPTYNRSQLLQHTLESIRRQSIDHKLMETIVVDDGSVDNTKEIVEMYRKDLTIEYFFQEDLGYRVATARNTGIEHAKGKVLLFVDSGIILTKNCVAEHLRSHWADAFNLVVIGYIFFVDDPGSVFRDLLLSESGLEYSISEFLAGGIHLDYREPVYKTCDGDISSLPAPWVLCWTGNVSMKTEIVRAANRFDTHFDMNWGMEDVDLGFRLYKTGTLFTVNKKASSVHYPHVSNLEAKLSQEKINKVYFHNKHNSRESRYLLDSTTVDLNFRLGIKADATKQS
jgi:glycosyltransferase involved in cell wall biosynthesis